MANRRPPTEPYHTELADRVHVHDIMRYAGDNWRVEGFHRSRGLVVFELLRDDGAHGTRTIKPSARVLIRMRRGDITKEELQ
jgi:hypothetical protein